MLKFLIVFAVPIQDVNVTALYFDNETQIQKIPGLRII